MANLYIIALDLEVDGKVSLNEAHRISKKVDDLIKEKIPNVYDVLIHLDPEGIEEDEVYGVSAKELN